MQAKGTFLTQKGSGREGLRVGKLGVACKRRMASFDNNDKEKNRTHSSVAPFICYVCSFLTSEQIKLVPVGQVLKHI